MKTIEIYRNKKGFILFGIYQIGFDGKFEYFKLNNKDVFYLHFLFFHFFFLKPKTS